MKPRPFSREYILAQLGERGAGYDPRKTQYENNGEALYDRDDEELEWAKEKEAYADAASPWQMAHRLAAEGRGSDTEIAHVALGELVIPHALQTPELLSALRRAAAAHDVPLNKLRVGSAMNSVNPRTGAPEFGFIDKIKEIFSASPTTSRSSSQPSPSFIPTNNADTMEAPTFESLGFNPKGLTNWQIAALHPVDAWRANRIGNQVIAEAIKKFGGDRESLVNGPGDAWRHGRLMQRLAHELGPERAKEFADAHERSNANAPGEQLMDVHNNQVGLSLPYDPKGHIDPNLALQNAFNNGYLRTKPFGR